MAEPTKQTQRRSFFRAHPVTALAAMTLGVGTLQTPTATNDFLKATTTSTIGAPERSIMEAALRDKAIDFDMANALWLAAPDEALTWEYMYLPKQVEAYYSALEKLIRRDCKNQLAKCSPLVQEYAKTLYKNFRLSPEYRQWDRSKREVFMAQAAADPMLMRARQYWHIKPGAPHYISIRERMKMMQHLSNLYTDAYTDGATVFKRARVVGYRLHPDLAGQYCDGQIRIRARDLRRYGFTRMVQVITHETRHNVQHALAQLSYSDEGAAYLKAHGVLREARIMALVFGAGAPANRSVHDEGYWTSPVENEAYAKQSDGEVTGRGAMPHVRLFATLDAADASIATQRRQAMAKMAEAIRPAI